MIRLIKKYRKKTKVNLGRYLYEICSKEKLEFAFVFGERLDYSNFSQKISLKKVYKPSDLEKSLIGSPIYFHSVNVFDTENYNFQTKHEELVRDFKKHSYKYRNQDKSK